MALKQIDDPNIILAALIGGGLGRFVEEQERNGQRALVASVALPTRRSDPDSVYESLGFKFGKVLHDDPLFQLVDLPSGWSKVATDHSMWSNIIDNKGRKRAMVFYKAVFYDRSAHMSLSTRFRVALNYDRKDYETFREWQVFDVDKVLLSRYAEHAPVDDWTENNKTRKEIDDKCRDACEKLLTEMVPRWREREWQVSQECWEFEVKT